MDYKFLPEERETIITLDDADSKIWNVFTMQRKITHKLDKIGAKPYKVEKDSEDNIISAEYKLNYNQISFRKISEKRELTEEQKQEIADRLAKARMKNK